MKNIKTSLCGLFGAIAGFVVFSPDTFARWPLLLVIARYVMAGGLAGIGFFAKDFNTHSTEAQVEKSTATEAK